MRIIFMGTPSFSASILDEIIKSGSEVAAVVTKEDKKRSRGGGADFSEVKKLAVSRQIPVFQPSRVRDEEFVMQLKALMPDLIVTAAYGKIIPSSILELPKYGCINVHASLLPKYRGASPIQQAIMDGERHTGITIIQMDEGMDTGDMLLKEEIEIYPDETSVQLFGRMAEVGGKLCVKCIKMIENNEIVPIKQDEALATYTALIPKDAGHIDWNMPANSIVNRVRAIECYFYDEDQRIRLLKASVCTNSSILDKIEDNNIPVGSVISASIQDGLVIKAGDGAVYIEMLQRPSKKPCDYKAYINGYKPKLYSVWS